MDGSGLVKSHISAGIAVLTIDNPPVNATSHALRSALKTQIEAALADDAVTAVILIGAGRGFIAGADISEFERKRDEPLNPAIIAVMENSKKPIICAIHGHALGGGLELAMGCHYRLATPEVKLGQPEVKIGITPGAGGTQRLPRLVGLTLALDMIVGGDPIPAQKALERGLLDMIVESDLRQAAIDFAARAVREKMPLNRVRDLPPPIRPEREFFTKARAALEQHSPALTAPKACIDAIEASLLPIDEGLQREAAIFAGTIVSEQARALRYIFFAERDAGKVPDLPADTPTIDIKKVGVVGGGTTGNAITISFADAGYAVTLVETDALILNGVQTSVRQHYEAAGKRSNLAAEEIERRIACIRLTASMADLGDADIVVETVAEDIDAKTKALGEIDRAAKPGALIATSTAQLDIEILATATKRPENLFGLHFFAPIAKTRTVEIVRANQTVAKTAATGMAIGRKLRKIPVAMRARDGFVSSRLLARRDHAIDRLLKQGVAPVEIDEARIGFGFPAGLGLGQSAGARSSLSAREIIARILYPMINEGARLLEEGVAIRASDIDVIWVYGYGFPAYRGGPMFYADNVGLASLRDRLTADAARYDDPSLKPANLLVRLADEGKSFREHKA
jgi:3-hydroxyacyl-CoA dehydrogenase